MNDRHITFLLVAVLPFILLWMLLCAMGWAVLTFLAFVLRMLRLRRAAEWVSYLAWELWAT